MMQLETLRSTRMSVERHLLREMAKPDPKELTFHQSTEFHARFRNVASEKTDESLDRIRLAYRIKRYDEANGVSFDEAEAAIEKIDDRPF